MLPRLVILLTLLALPFASGEVESDIPLGIETLTGLRSNYIYRGFNLADATLEAQIETEIAFDEENSLLLAVWHVSESGGDFADTAVSFGYQRDFADFRVTAFLDYHAFESDLFENGIDLGLKGQWFLSGDWDLALEYRHDFGAEGDYFALEAGWSQPFSEELFVTAESGVSAVSDYYERDGLNDFYGRVTLTYNVNSFLSLSPFIGYSLALADESDDEVEAGLWLAVSF